MSFDKRLQKLSDRHHEIARLLTLGFSNKEIAQQLGLDPSTISQVKQSPLLRAKVEELSQGRDENTKDIRTSFENLAPQAIEALQTMVRNEDGSVMGSTQLNAAKYVLEVLGHSSVRQNKHIIISTAVDPKRLVEIRDAMINNQKRIGIQPAEGAVIDV